MSRASVSSGSNACGSCAKGQLIRLGEDVDRTGRRPESHVRYVSSGTPSCCREARLRERECVATLPKRERRQRRTGLESAPSRSTLPRVRREVKIASTTSGLYDRNSRDRRNAKTNGDSLERVRGPVENAESDRSISVHNRLKWADENFTCCEFFRKRRARQDSNLRPPA